MTLAFGHPRGTDGGRPRAPLARVALSATASLALVAVGIGGAAPALAAPAPAQVTERDFPTSLATPEDALAYLVFELDEASDQWAQSQALIERAGFGDALEQARDEALQDAAGNDLPLDALLGGEGAVVVTADAIEALVGASAGLDAAAGLDDAEATPEAEVDSGFAPAIGAVFLLDARAPDTAYAALRASVEDQAAETGASVEEVDYQGVTIEYAARSDDPVADGTGDAMAVAQIDDLIALAVSPTDLEPIIDTAQGGPSLADFGPFGDVRAELDDESLLFGFFNGVAAAEAQANLGDLGGFGGLAGSSGLAGAGTYTGLLLRADEPGFRLETVAAPAEGEALPPATANYQSELATRIPGDALFFLSGAELGETGILDAIGAGVLALALGGFSEGGASATPIPDQTAEELIADQYVQAEGLLGFNLQTDLFQQFVGEFGLSLSSEADPSSISALFATDVADPGTVVNALDRLNLLVQGATGAQGEATTRQVDGSQVTVVDTGDPAVPDVEFGVVDDQFLLGLGTAIDDYVEDPADVLADNPQYQDVMAALPTDINGQLYVDLAQIVPLLQGLAAAQDAGAADDLSIADADPSCENYDTQAEAQEAYDAGDEDTFDLDQDFDGEVCEDFFAEATPEAAAAASPVAEIDFSAIRAFGLVAYEEGGLQRSSSILYIEEAE